MFIKKIKINFECKQNTDTGSDDSVDFDVNNLDVVQGKYREYIRTHLLGAQELKMASLEIDIEDSRIADFPIVGSAKIAVQEILRLSKEKDCAVGEINLFYHDVESLKVYQTTFEDYVKHIVETLGPGPYVTCDVIIEMKDGIILIERSNPPYGWALPGGFLDHDESLEEAAIREAREETNMDLENLKQFHTYSDPSRDPRFHTISTVFIAKGIGTPQFGDDAKGLKIVSYKELMQLKYAFDHNQIIKDYLGYREMKNGK